MRVTHDRETVVVRFIIKRRGDSVSSAFDVKIYAECHSDLPKVGNVDEAADPKIVSWCGMDVYARSVYHSHPLIKPSNFSPGRKSITTKLGKR